MAGKELYKILSLGSEIWSINYIHSNPQLEAEHFWKLINLGLDQSGYNQIRLVNNVMIVNRTNVISNPLTLL